MDIGIHVFDVDNLFKEFKTISLKQAIQIDLNSRREIKFLVPSIILFKSLNNLRTKFLVQLNSKNEYYNTYSTRYWDTQDKSFFFDHIRGRNKRVKIRKRLYEDTGDVVFEVKQKINEKTIKKRLNSTYTEKLNLADINFLESHNLFYSNLEHALDVRYNRITLWDIHLTGRVTIDFKYSVGVDKEQNVFNNICIVELKGDQNLFKFTTQQINFPLYKYKSSFSKYAIGIIHQYLADLPGSKNLLPIYKKLCKLNLVS